MDVRLKTAKYVVEGKEYELRCNMNVLADVQEGQGGNFLSLLQSPNVVRTALVFGAAMLNDYADEKGWPERYTDRQLGRMISADDFSGFSSLVMGLVVSAAGKTAEDGDDDGAGNPEKN